MRGLRTAPQPDRGRELRSPPFRRLELDWDSSPYVGRTSHARGGSARCAARIHASARPHSSRTCGRDRALIGGVTPGANATRFANKFACPIERPMVSLLRLRLRCRTIAGGCSGSCRCGSGGKVRASAPGASRTLHCSLGGAVDGGRGSDCTVGVSTRGWPDPSLAGVMCCSPAAMRHAMRRGVGGVARSSGGVLLDESGAVDRALGDGSRVSRRLS